MTTHSKVLLGLVLSATFGANADAQLFGKRRVIDVSEKAKPAEEKSTKNEASKAASPVSRTLDGGKQLIKQVVSDDYIIGVEDVLMVNVWREPEISRQVPVRPDGKISLPLLGEFVAAGKTPIQLQEDLKKKLETVVTNPEVTVIVNDIRSQKFTILGEVASPGSYPLTKPMSVLEAIAVAGGFKDFANPKKMYILRRTADGKSERIPFDYNRMLKGDVRQPILELESRDTIVVP